jgi:hypothetical protein
LLGFLSAKPPKLEQPPVRDGRFAAVLGIGSEAHMKRSLMAVALVGAFALSGCGYNKGDRALTGGALGAAGGAAIGAMAGAPLAGALIGGAGGAAAGALTSPRDVNLGRPIYR